MHEQSLVQSLLKQIKQISHQHDAVSVNVVTVELGPLSGVEPELISTAFEQLAPVDFTPTPRLEIRLIDLVIRCRNCEAEFPVPNMTFRCPACTSPHVQIIRGDQFRFIDVSLEIPDSSCEAVS